MLTQSRSPRQDGLLLFLYLSHIGKFAWQLDFQQVISEFFSELFSFGFAFRALFSSHISFMESSVVCVGSFSLI